MEEEACKAIQKHEESLKSNETPQRVGREKAEKAEPIARILNHVLQSNLPAEDKTIHRMGDEAFTVIAAKPECRT